MAIEVLSVEAHDEFWNVALRVYEGVYRKDRYMARVVNVPVAPESLSEENRMVAMKNFVLDQVKTHMRHGSLPPSGMQIEGEKVWLVEPEPVNQ
jgi:hypothetical protein